MKTCKRCGATVEYLYGIRYYNEYQENEILEVCWDCEFDISNGADMFADPGDIIADRLQNDYDYDPVNQVCPY